MRLNIAGGDSGGIDACRLGGQNASFYMPSGFAHLRFSMRPVLGHLISCHEIGSKVAPASLVANMTPSSFFAVDKK